MTISNSNLLSAVQMKPDMRCECMVSGQMSVAPVDLDSSGQSYSDADFWSMLNQQLFDMEAPQEGLTDSTQVTENEGLFSFMDISGGEQKGSAKEPLLDDSGLGMGWLQGMKSHFSDAETRLSLSQSSPQAVDGTELDAAQAVDPLTGLLGPSLNITEAADDSLIGGDRLPLARQIVSEMPLPQAVAQALSIKPESGALSSAPASTGLGGTVQTSGFELDVDLSGLHRETSDQEKAFSASLSKGDVEPDELFKQAAMDVAVSNPKEAATTLQAQLNPTATATLQHQSAQPLPPTLQDLKLSPQAPASQWGEAVGEKVALMFNSKLNSAEIRLDPPHLGKLEIQIQLKDDTATVVINTQHAQTRDLLDAASARLKEFLQEAGYSSVDVDVSHREQSMAQGESGQGEGGTASQENVAGQQSNINLAADAISGELTLSVDNGRIDFFA